MARSTLQAYFSSARCNAILCPWLCPLPDGFDWVQHIAIPKRIPLLILTSVILDIFPTPGLCPPEVNPMVFARIIGSVGVFSFQVPYSARLPSASAPQFSMGECIEDEVIGLFQRTLGRQHATPKLGSFVSAECDGLHRLSTPSLCVPNVFVCVLVLKYGHALHQLGIQEAKHLSNMPLLRPQALKVTLFFHRSSQYFIIQPGFSCDSATISGESWI